MKVNVRVVGATNVDLPASVEAGKFRADLLDRLSFDVVTLPPLRARPVDILELGEAFGIRMAKTLGHPLFPGFAASCRQALLDYHWPGNVRELRNVIERAVYRAGPTELPIETIQIDPFESPWRPGQERKNTTPQPLSLGDFATSVANFEADLLRRALAAGNGSQTQAAQQLGLGYHQFRRLLKKHKL